MDIVLLWAGLMFVAAGALIIRSTDMGGSSTTRVEGEVLGYVPSGGKESARTFSPVVAFTHPVAGRRVFESAFGSGTFPYPLGARVTVLADIEDPSRARIDTRAFLWFGLVFIAIGIGCGVLFVSVFRLGWLSIAASAVVSALVVWKLRHKRDEIGKLGSLPGLVRHVLTGNVVEEERYDRSRLLPREAFVQARRRSARQSALGGAFLVLVGIGGIAGSWIWSGQRIAFMNRAAPADGVVVELSRSSDAESATWAPVVEFTPQHASGPVRFRHSVASSHPAWTVGQRVAVLYDPLEPSRAMIDQGWWSLAFPLLPGALGLLALALGLAATMSGLRSETVMG